MSVTTVKSVFGKNGVSQNRLMCCPPIFFKSSDELLQLNLCLTGTCRCGTEGEILNSNRVIQSPYTVFSREVA